MPFDIALVHARQILDSRGNPTVEVEVVLEGGAVGRAAVPSGASTGENEAVELRDGDKGVYLGKGVTKAVANVNDRVAPAPRGSTPAIRRASTACCSPRRHRQQEQARRQRMLGVSMAIARASAEGMGLPLYRYLGGTAAKMLPVPMLNILNGGKHADNTVDFQEFMIQPWGFDTSPRRMRAGVEIYHTLKGVLKDRKMSTAVGDEGGFAPDLKDNEDALKVIEEATEKAGTRGASRSSSHSTRHKRTVERGREGRQDRLQVLLLQPGDHLQRRPDRHLGRLVRKYPIRSIEDGLAENDWEGWKKLTDRSATRSSSSAMTCSSPTSRSCSAASTRAAPTRCSSR
jgi:enolase